LNDATWQSQKWTSRLPRTTPPIPLTMPAIKHPVKINVDLGEGYGNFKCGPDDELIPLIDHANIACGFHAGYVAAIHLAADRNTHTSQ
jgi:hypothetical protein